MPCPLEACKLAKPQTIQASPLQQERNGRVLRQVVSRLIRRSAATILTERLEAEITIGDPNSRCVGGYFVLEWEGNQMGGRSQA
jgi:hypothetical protein